LPYAPSVVIRVVIVIRRQRIQPSIIFVLASQYRSRSAPLVNLLKPTDYGMKQVEYFNCTLCPHCICVFCGCLRTNSDLCHLQYKLIGFYNRNGKCLQRGTDWVFKWSGLRLCHL
jgi:hypothetical protein